MNDIIVRLFTYYEHKKLIKKMYNTLPMSLLKSSILQTHTQNKVKINDIFKAKYFAERSKHWP